LNYTGVVSILIRPVKENKLRRSLFSLRYR